MGKEACKPSRQLIASILIFALTFFNLPDAALFAVRYSTQLDQYTLGQLDPTEVDENDNCSALGSDNCGGGGTPTANIDVFFITKNIPQITSEIYNYAAARGMTVTSYLNDYVLRVKQAGGSATVQSNLAELTNNVNNLYQQYAPELAGQQGYGPDLEKPTPHAFIPNDPLYNCAEPVNGCELGQWNLDKIQAVDAWDIGGSNPVKIAVLDSGIRLEHSDLRDDLVYYRYNINTDTFTTTPDHFSGTQVTGIIAAHVDNDWLISGMFPGMTLQVADIQINNPLSPGDATLLRITEGLCQAIGGTDCAHPDNHADADIVYMGYFFPTISDGTMNAFLSDWNTKLGNANKVMVIPAGNANQLKILNQYSRIIVVGGTTRTDARMLQSNHGIWIDLGAPSGGLDTPGIPQDRDNLLTIDYADNDGYIRVSGTSFSAAEAAGTLGLVLSANPDYPIQNLKQLLQDTADPYPSGMTNLGAGRLNACKAVAVAQGLDPSVCPPPYGILLVPEGELNASGAECGPFNNSVTYQLKNIGGRVLYWEAEKANPGSDWYSISPDEGTLLERYEEVTVTVSFNPNAYQLPVGSYSDLVVFTNTASGYTTADESASPSVGPQIRNIELNVHTPCDDGNVCNGTEMCGAEGGCQPGTPLNCDDNDNCTIDSCDPVTGCAHEPVICPDGFCDPDNGQCVECLADVDCNDSNACTSGACVNNACEYEPVNCDDANACTANSCDPVLGCVSEPVNCDDANACTVDSCDSLTGCAHEPVICPDGFCDPDNGQCVECLADVDCNDSNACTSGACVNNACEYEPIEGCCSDETECSDGNICTENSCVDNLCVFTPIEGCQACTDNSECDDGNPCTDDICLIALGGGDGGRCMNLPADDGTSCDDGLFCNGVNTCQAGICEPGTPVDCSGLNDQCNAGVCDEASGGCVPEPVNEGASCDDGLFCTSGSLCETGVCVADETAPPVCDDGDICTENSCDEGLSQCVFTPIPGCGVINEPPQVNAGPDQTVGILNITDLDGIVTDDGLPEPPSLTIQWSKVSGAGDVEFGNVSSPVTTAVFTELGAYVLRLWASDGELEGSDEVAITVVECMEDIQCNDANPCTIGSCAGNSCVFEPIEGCEACEVPEDCDDGNACTHNYCYLTPMRVGICANPPVEDGAACDDGLFCNGVNTCQAGTCEPGTPVDCSGLNDQCNTGICSEEASGACIQEPVNEGLSCDDGLFCTSGETCQLGNCLPPDEWVEPVCNDGDICTIDTCDEANRQCVYENIEGCRSCFDNSECNDGNPCTDDICLVTLGGQGGICMNLNSEAGTSCSDSVFCNGEELCDGSGSCLPAAPVDCSGNDLASIATCFNDPDNNPFTFDSFLGFASVCDEINDQCTTGTINLTHVCSIDQCGASCENDSHCIPTNCDHLDGCVGMNYHDYSDVANTCLSSCACTNNACGPPVVTPNDPRCGQNQPPTVDAGPNRTISIASPTANLDGTVTDDGLPNPPGQVDILWTKISGPGSVTFDNAGSEDTAATFSEMGTYVLHLWASDGELEASDTVQIRVVPDVEFDPNQSFRRKGFTMTFRDGNGGFYQYPGAMQFDDTCVMFRAIGKWYYDGTYQPLDCGADENYTDCWDLKSTGPVHIVDHWAAGEDPIISHPRWKEPYMIKGYVPDVDFLRPGCSDPQDAYNVAAYNFAVTMDCDAYKNSSIVEYGTYRVDRDPMMSPPTNGRFDQIIEIEQIYIGQYPIPENGNAGSPLYTGYPNPDLHTMPVTVDGPAYTLYVKTNPGADEMIDYAAYRRGWVAGPGTGSGYGVSYGNGQYYGSFTPKGRPAVFEVLTGSYGMGPTPFDFKYPNHPDGWGHFPVTMFNGGFSAIICSYLWRYGNLPTNEHGCFQDAIYPDGASGTAPVPNPYIGGYTVGMHPFFRSALQLTYDERNAIMNWGEDVYKNVWIMHDVLGYSKARPRQVDCENYTQIRLRRNDLAFNPSANTSLCTAGLECSGTPNPPPCHVTAGCNTGTGTWIYEPGNDGASCDDYLSCTVNDICVAGECKGASICDDGNPATIDMCTSVNGGQCGYSNYCELQNTECRAATGCGANGECEFENIREGLPCDDGNACTTQSSCQAGACVSPQTNPCDDGIGCTDDICHPQAGCMNIPKNNNCNDPSRLPWHEGQVNTCVTGVCDPYNQFGYGTDPITGCNYESWLWIPQYDDGRQYQWPLADGAQCTNANFSGQPQPQSGDLCDTGAQCNSNCQCESLCGNSVYNWASGELCDPSVPLCAQGNDYHASQFDKRACGDDCQPCVSCGDGNVSSILREQCDDGMWCPDLTTRCSRDADCGGEFGSCQKRSNYACNSTCQYQCWGGMRDGVVQGDIWAEELCGIDYVCNDGTPCNHPEYVCTSVFIEGEECDRGSTSEQVQAANALCRTLYGQNSSCGSNCRCTIPTTCQVMLPPISEHRWEPPSGTDGCKWACVAIINIPEDWDGDLCGMYTPGEQIKQAALHDFYCGNQFSYPEGYCPSP